MENYSPILTSNQYNFTISLPSEAKKIVSGTYSTKSCEISNDNSTDSNSLIQEDTDRSNDHKHVDCKLPSTSTSNNPWTTKVNKTKLGSSYVKTMVISSPSAAIIKASQEEISKINSFMGNKSVQEYLNENYKEEERERRILYNEIKSKLAKQKQIEDLADKTIKCSVSSVTYFNRSHPLFGYLVNFEYDKTNKKMPYLIPELVSFKALPKTLRENLESLKKNNSIVYKSKEKNFHYYTWLPMYISESHFRDCWQFFENSIRKLSCINQEAISVFSPKMILDVLLPIIKSLIFKIRESHESNVAEVQALGQLFNLTQKLLSNDYPKLKQDLDEQVLNYLLENDENFKSQDLMTIALLSDVNLFSDEIISGFLSNSLEDALIKINKLDKKKIEPQEWINPLRKTTQILLTFIETWRFLKNEESADDFEFRYGILNSERIIEFEKRIKSFKKIENCTLRALKLEFPNHIDIRHIKAELKSLLSLKKK